jgi:crossover junction endodeoxyribonuclease RuvC
VRFVGIDPGLGGAIAFIDHDYANVYDMPRGPDGIDANAVFELLQSLVPTEVYLERTHAMPLNGSKAAFSQGDSNGVLRAVVHLLHVPLIWVNPKQWQAHVRLAGPYSATERKMYHRDRAKELFPALRPLLNRVKDHDRADALLIARYGADTSITAAVLSG